MIAINLVVILAFLLVNGVLVYFIVRYRRRGPDDQTSKIAHSTILEITWTVVPTIVFFALFFWGLFAYLDYRRIPENAREITVRAWQWGWEYNYPRDLAQNRERPVQLKTTRDVFLEEGVPVKFVMTSSDVLHSFFIPAFRSKEDVVPGMFTYVSVTPVLNAAYQQAGRAEYPIFCTEYCGRDHSYMTGTAIVLNHAQFSAEMAKLEAEASNITADRGAEIYRNVCHSCHSLDGSRIVGPSFKGLYGSRRDLEGGTTVDADENYVRNSLLNPGDQIARGYPNAMPPQNMSDSEILSMIEFLKAQR
ncbi:MAG: cytochrome c oxidase subunit II [Leptospirales bacterium]|nr:cytochrome c oxidase subunit II [Leptospirales bacterium]